MSKCKYLICILTFDPLVLVYCLYQYRFEPCPNQQGNVIEFEKIEDVDGYINNPTGPVWGNV